MQRCKCVVGSAWSGVGNAFSFTPEDGWDAATQCCGERPARHVQAKRLGFSSADRDKRLPVPAHGYRPCLIAGIQPAQGRRRRNRARSGSVLSTVQQLIELCRCWEPTPLDSNHCPDCLEKSHMRAAGGRH
jgi:hypothetical protein